MKLPPELFSRDESDGYEYGWDYFDKWVKTFNGREWVLERRWNEIWYSIPLWRRAIIKVIGWLKGVKCDD